LPVPAKTVILGFGGINKSQLDVPLANMPRLPTTWKQIERDAVSFRKSLAAPGSPVRAWDRGVVYTFACSNSYGARREMQQFLGGILGLDLCNIAPTEAAAFLAYFSANVKVTEEEWGQKWHGGPMRMTNGTRRVRSGMLENRQFMRDTGCTLTRLNINQQRRDTRAQVLGVILLNSAASRQNRRCVHRKRPVQASFIRPWVTDACPICGHFGFHQNKKTRLCPFSTAMLQHRGHHFPPSMYCMAASEIRRVKPKSRGKKPLDVVVVNKIVG
jgi:hypothetical protein